MNEKEKLTHGWSKTGVEGFIIEIEMSAGFDHVAHDTAESQAASGLFLFAFRREFAISRLYAFFLHGQRSVNLKQWEATIR